MITQALIKARRFIRILRKTTAMVCNLLFEKLLEILLGKIVKLQISCESKFKQSWKSFPREQC